MQVPIADLHIFNALPAHIYALQNPPIFTLYLLFISVYCFTSIFRLECADILTISLPCTKPLAQS